MAVLKVQRIADEKHARVIPETYKVWQAVVEDLHHPIRPRFIRGQGTVAVVGALGKDYAASKAAVAHGAQCL